jgi:uncharacterized protein involved in exopolysaccharide biosynthesis
MSINQENISQANVDNDEISLRELILEMKVWFEFLKSKWRIIFLVGAVGGLIGLTVAWFEKPTYKATLTFAMEEDKGGGGGLSGALGLASSFGIDLGGAGGGGAFAASNITELMKSRLIIEKVLIEPIIINDKKIPLIEYYIETFGLQKDWWGGPTLNKKYFSNNVDRNQFSLQQDSILKEVYKNLIEDNLNISQKDKKVTILTIEVKSKDELFSKVFCESLAKETSDFYIETKSKKARLNANILQKQVDSIRAELNGSITKVALEIDNVYNLNPALNIKGTASKKKQIDVQSNTALLTNLVVQLELAKITLRKETPLIQLIDKPILPLIKEKFGKLKSLFLGGILALFLSVFYLIFVQIFKKILI